MIPLPVILVEFVGAFGLALFLANAVALVRLRRDGRAGSEPAAADGRPAPSRPRILTGLVLGLIVTLWASASWITNGYRF